MSQVEAPHILYIDDDLAMSRLVAKSLTKNGFRVSLAHRGADGLELLAANRFDVIGLDHSLPDFDGFDLFEEIRMQADCPPIVYVTGNEDIDLAIEALKSGASDFVVKDTERRFLTLLARAFRAAVEKEQLKRAKDQAELEKREANARLEQLTARQIVLLREMNHRIGNSLQLITSMIRMQSMSTQNQEVRQVLQQAVERVIAVSQVHQRLYTSEDVQFVQMRPYINQILADHKVTADLQHCHFTIEVSDIALETDRAIALGIIATELAANALRHAYPTDGGPIRVSLKEGDPQSYQLVIEDEGVGLGENTRGGSVGARIVDGMAKRLKSQLVADASARGARLVLRFPRNAATVE